MGRSHVTMGICSVVLASGANWISWDEPQVAMITTGLVLAGSVLPDLDHKSSHVSRSFGPFTYVLSDVVRFISRRVYRMSRLPHDPPNRDPHRTFTHTWPGALAAGGVLTLALVAGQWPAVVAVAMLFGMAARAFDKSFQPFAAIAGGLLMWDLWPAMGDALWTFWIALAAGCWLHVYTDCVTKAGAPMAWPRVTEKREVVEENGQTRTRVLQRRRWHMTGPPQWIRFYAGSWVEGWIVRGTVVLTVLLTYWLVTAV